MSDPTVFRAGLEPIPGYVLRQRLGAGGYGEVWSADAPGGLKKAIKLVYGSLDQRRASTELRSLQRIRQVHHPLLLSLERIEIIHGQLIIVTELAECSLTDVFHAARRRELQGIPREQLLDFLKDAGDALDYLSQKHDLQHLDVKPGNLLIMADRIKVADFGLIKDLHDSNLSLVSGLTPSHAAPELFDGRPDRLSDLYSLAIVYQEMLTGKLPFSGKSAGELARQHLHQAPDLEPLPPADRRVVARALAKHPLDRYPSCRAFIDELRNSGAHEKYAAKSRINDIDTESPVDLPSGGAATETSTCASPALLGGLAVMPSLPTAGSVEGWRAPPCMFIGVGGIGCQALTSLRALLEQKADSRHDATDHEWLAIDTDFDLLAEVSSARHPGNIEYRDTCHLKLFRPQEYRGRSDDRFGAISRRWLYNIPRSLKTEGVRPLAMLALVDHLERVQQRIYAQLKTLVDSQQSLESSQRPPLRIYVCSSLHGGTGSAISPDIGRLVRSALAQLQCSEYLLMATVSIATTAGQGGGLPAAAALASLCELDAQMEGCEFIPPLGRETSLKPSSSSKPFDCVTLIDGGMHGNAQATLATIDALAESLWIDSHTLIGPTLDAARHDHDQPHSRHVRPWLRAARSSLVQLGQDLQPSQLARLCCAQAIQRWHSCVAGGLVAQEVLDSNSHPLSWSPAQTNAIVEHLSGECLRVLRLIVDAPIQNPAAAPGPNPWRSRSSQNSEVVRLQIDRDMRTFHAWFAEHMRPSYISWKVLQRIVLRAVERMMELASGGDEVLQKLSSDDAADPEAFTPAELAACRQYIQMLSAKCLQQLQAAQPRIRCFGDSLGAWLDSLQAEQTTHDGLPGLTVCDGHVPIGWRNILQRAHGTLDATLHRYVVQQCFRAPLEEQAANEKSGERLCLKHLVSLSTDLISRMMRDAGIQAAEQPQLGGSTAGRSVVLQEIDDLIPSAAQRGGRLYRLLAMTASQQSEMGQRLKQLELTQSCTLVPAHFGEVPVVVCDASDLNLPGLISAFWRPTSETFRLAERLHTRCDVAWPPIDVLLAAPTLEPAV